MENNNDPIKRKELHTYLKQEGMTDLDYNSFSNEYSSNSEKSKNLYSYLKEEGMTDLDENSFKEEYFGDLKKKEESGSTAQNQKLVSEPEVENGSSDSPQTNNQPQGPIEDYLDAQPKKEDNTSKPIDWSISDTSNSNEDRMADVVNPLLQKYNTPEYSLSDTDIEEAKNTVDKENNGDFGFWETIKNTASKAWTGFDKPTPKQIKKAEIKKDLIKNEGVKASDITDELLDLKFTEKRTKEILDAKKDAKTEEFIETLSSEEKLTMENYFHRDFASLQISNKRRMFEMKDSKSKIDDIDNQIIEISQTLKQAREDLKKDPEAIISEEIYEKNNALYEKGVELSEKRNEIAENYNKSYNDYSKTNEDIKSTSNEIDLFKREYGWLTNAANKTMLASVEMGLNIENTLDKLGFYSMTGAPKSSVHDFQESKKPITDQAREKIAKQKDLLRKPKSLDDIKGAESFLEWSMDLVSEQAPNTAMMALTGGASLPIMGLSSFGAKFEALEQEEKNSLGAIRYSDFKKYGSSFVSGIVEPLSEKVSLGQIRRAQRVFKSIGRKELNEGVGTYFKNQFKKENILIYGKDTFEEGFTESISQLADNVSDKYFLGKENVNITDGLLDSFVSGAFMSGVAYKIPLLARHMSQPFLSKDTNQKIGENVVTLSQIGKELKNTDLNEKTRKSLEDKRKSILEENNQLLDKTIEDTKKLSNKERGRLVAIENKKYKLRKEAKELQEDTTLSDEMREVLAEDITKKFESLEAKKEGVINPKKLEDLPKEEVSKLKEEAEDELIKEQDQESDYTITDKQIEERAKQKLKESQQEEGIEDVPSPTVDLNPENTNKPESNEQNEKTTEKETKSQVEETAPKSETESKPNQETVENTNETAQEPNITTNEVIEPGTRTSEQQGQDNEIQPTIESKTSDTEVEIKRGRNSYKVSRKNGVLEVKNSKGKKVSKPTERAILKEYAESYDFTEGDTFQPQEGMSENEVDLETQNSSNNPAELAEIALRTQTNDFIEGNSDTEAIQIIEYVQGNIKRGKKGEKGNDGSFVNNSDSNNITQSIAKTYLKADGRGLDVLAQELSEELGKEVTEQDIINIMLKYPNGVNDVKKEVRDNYSNPAKARFRELTGFPASDYYLEKAVEQAIAKEKLNENAERTYLDSLTDEELISLSQEKTDYEKSINKGPKSKSTSSNTKKDEKKSRVQEKSNRTKPEASKLKDVLKQDNIQDKLDFLDTLKLDPNTLNSTLPFAPQAWNAFIEALKLSLKAGNTIQKAIKFAVSKLEKEGFDLKDITAVAKKFTKEHNIDSETKNIEPPKGNTNNQKTTFKNKKGQKSVLTRAATGGANKTTTDALKKHGLDYEVQSQQEAKERAESFVKDVGIDATTDALINGTIEPGAELAFIYGSVIDALEKALNSASGKAQKVLEEKYSKIQEDIFISFDSKAREFGRFLAALNNVYNSSYYKYNLSKQVNDYKARNPHELDAAGNIPADVMAKFEERDAKLKEFEQQIKELQDKLEKAEAQQSVDHIKESIDREKGKKTPKKKLDPKEAKRKKELFLKFFTANDITRMVTLLAEKDFREYLGLVLKEANYDLQNFKNEITDKWGDVNEIIPRLYETAKEQLKPKKKTLSEDQKRKIYIKRLITDIEDLDIQIENRKRDVKIKQDKYANDSEIKTLRDIKKSKQDELSKIDPSFSERNKLEKDLIKAQKSLDEYQRRIDENDFSSINITKKEVDKKLKELRLKRDDKRKEFQKAKKSNEQEHVKTESPREKSVRRKIEQTKKSIERLQEKINNPSSNSNEGKKSVWNSEISKLKQEELILRKQLNDAKKESLKDKKEEHEESEVTIDEEGNIKIPKQVIRDYVESGIEDIDVLAQTIIDDHFPNENLTLRQVRDAITNYGKTINPTQDELSEQISKMKNLGKTISGMEDVQEGQRPKRSGYQRRKKSDEERRKERELKEAMRELPMDQGDLDNQWKTQLDTVKSRLKNQIRDLQDQIDKKEKSKPNRQPIEYDQEAKDLASERDALKKTLESIVGKSELTDEQKVKMVEKALESSINKLEESIKSGNIFFKKKKSISSENITKLRKRQSKLRDELNEMREASGLIEQRRIENLKNAVAKRLAELQEKRRNKDYSKKQRKAPPEDAELKEKQREYKKEKEKYDQEAYEDELRKMHWVKKAGKQFVNFLGLQRVLLATGEFSFVFLQNAVPTINLLVKDPVRLGKIIAQTAKSYSQRKFDKDYAQMEGHELYELAVKSRLAITRTNFKMNAKEEAFQSDLVTSAFKLLGRSLDPKGTKRKTVYDTIFGVFDLPGVNREKVKVSEQIENLNPFAAMERFTTTYGNHIKMDLFTKAVKKLESEGKNPIDHKADFERVANAINTLTGRASLGAGNSVSPQLNALFFSARFAASTFNKLNPIYYGYVLRDSENPNKVSVAQKMAISQVATYMATTTAFIFAIQALGGDDDEGEPIVQIENNPTSSDFGKLKIGNIRFDPWGGHLPWVVLVSRMATGEMKRSNGKVIKLGEGSNDNRFDKIVDFGVGKLNPTVATGVRFLRANEEVDGVKRDKYGNEVSAEEELKKMYPIYWQGIQEVIAENPEKGKAMIYSLTALGLLGVNNQVYGTSDKSLFKSYSKDVKNELNTRRAQYIRPNKENITSDKDLDVQFEKFKTDHITNYSNLKYRISEEMEKLSVSDIMFALKDSGYSKEDIIDIRQGYPPKMKLLKSNTIKDRLKTIKDRLQKKDQDKYDTIEKDVIKKAMHYNKKATEYNRLYRK